MEARSNQLSALAVKVTAALQIFTKLFRIHVVGLFVDVDERDLPSGLGNRFRGSDKGVRNGNDDLAGLHICRHECKAQRIRSAVHAYAIFRVAERREFAFKILHHRSADEAGITERLFHYSQKLCFEFLVRRNQVEKRNLREICHDLLFVLRNNRQKFCRISRNNSVGGHILGHYAAGSNNSVLADRNIAENRRSRTDRSTLADSGLFNFPVRLGLQARRQPPLRADKYH